MILSILIPTLPERNTFLRSLVFELTRQIGKREDIEILSDERGRNITTGEKRNALISKAIGKYIWFIDDDDEINKTSIRDILEATLQDPDVIVFNGYMTTNGTKKTGFELRLGHPYCAISRKGKEFYLRFPNHIVPMKRELIKNIKFEHISQGEDYRWAKKINDMGLLKTQVIIDKDIYHYRYRTK